MATKNFTDFSLQTPVLSSDYLVGYKTDGSEELRTTVDTLLDSTIKKSTTSYIIVQAGDSLATKYAEATTLTPSGSALSTTNRARLIVLPGNYSLSSELNINTQFVDIIGLGAQKLEKGSIPAVVISGNTLNVTANDVRISGISVGNQQFKIGDNLPLQRFEDCAGGQLSFNGVSGGDVPPGTGTVSGTFTNCTAGNSSFGTYGTASGTFTNCTAGDNSFGDITASGTFTNCTAGDDSFGGATASGTFTNCTANQASFGYTTASGTFTNCTAGISSFGYTTASGTFTNCTADYGFGGVTASGTFTNCTADYGFGGVTASGTFTNCTAEEWGFGRAAGPLVGTASGTFTNCTAGNSTGFKSFGSYQATGKFFQCRITSGTFTTVTGNGLMRNCIDGNNNIVNQ